MMGQLITSPKHAFGNVLRLVTRFPDLRGHNHVQITSPVREMRAALRLLQFKPEDRMFKPVSWVLLGGVLSLRTHGNVCSKPYTTPKSQGKFAPYSGR